MPWGGHVQDTETATRSSVQVQYLALCTSDCRPPPRVLQHALYHRHVRNAGYTRGREGAVCVQVRPSLCQVLLVETHCLKLYPTALKPYRRRSNLALSHQERRSDPTPWLRPPHLRSGSTQPGSPKATRDALTQSTPIPHRSTVGYLQLCTAPPSRGTSWAR